MIGARNILSPAFNVNLETADVSHRRALPAKCVFRQEAFAHVKALGICFALARSIRRYP